MKKYLLILLALGVSGIFNNLSAQKWAIKSNLLYDATATINVGVEAAIAKKWTIDVSGNYNAWTWSDERMWKHYMAQPEFRYWFCDRFLGHFIGVHALGGKYNIGNIDTDFKFLGKDFSPLSKYRYQGWFAGAGVAYGYAVSLGKSWNMEFEVGVGYIYSRYDKFECEKCGRHLEENVPVHYVGPTKAAINLVYLF